MKRVLFIAYLFPPILNSGTYRPLKFAKYLADYGWSPTVLTAAHFDGHPTDPELLHDLPPTVRVIRVPMLNERIASWFRAVLGETLGGRLGDAISWRLRARFRTPDMYALWKREVIQAALKVFNDTGFDAIFATGFPWTSLLAGREIARLTNRPLIADFRDPWAQEHLFVDERMSPEQELMMERQVVEDAHTVTTVAGGVVRLMAAAHPHVDESKFCDIHNGFDATDLPSRPRRPDQPFRIAYTGVWKKGYDQSALYDSIEWLQRAQPQVLEGVEVVCAGFTPGEARRRGIDSIVKELGVVSHSAAVELMQTADLLFMGYADPRRQWAVPGKLYEYLATGTPVLALTCPDGESAKVIREVGGAMVVAPGDPGALYNALAEICRHKRLDVPPRNDRALARFERRQLTGKLAAVLDQAYTTRSTRAGSSAASPTRSSYDGATSAQPATRVVS